MQYVAIIDLILHCITVAIMKYLLAIDCFTLQGTLSVVIKPKVRTVLFHYKNEKVGHCWRYHHMHGPIPLQA